MPFQSRVIGTSGFCRSIDFHPHQLTLSVNWTFSLLVHEYVMLLLFDTRLTYYEYVGVSSADRRSPLMRGDMGCYQKNSLVTQRGLALAESIVP